LRIPARLPAIAACALAATPGATSGCASRAPLERSGAPRPVPTVEVTGLILNGVTARPLPGASVDLDGWARAQSGPDGRFRVEAVPVGGYLLTTTRPGFRNRVQPVHIADPQPGPDGEPGPRNDFIVLLFAPSDYFNSFPTRGGAPACKTEADCASGQICLMINFREADASACTAPTRCESEHDCKIGQQCEPLTLQSGQVLRVCHGQPAPEVDR
jgi:hypothetical protein